MPLSWVELHGAVTHLPVACLLLAPAFEIGAALWRKPEWRVVSFWLLVVAVVLAVPSLATGWITGNDMHFTGGAAAPPTVFAQHRLAAFTASGLAIVMLAWRIATHDNLSRTARGAWVLLSLGAAGVIGFTGYLGGRMVFGGAESGAHTEIAGADRKTAPAPDARLVAVGAGLFQKYQCQSCHVMAGSGAAVGPDLTHEARRHPDLQWQIEHLKDPQKMTPGSAMPGQADLPAADLRALGAYLASRQ